MRSNSRSSFSRPSSGFRASSTLRVPLARVVFPSFIAASALLGSAPSIASAQAEAVQPEAAQGKAVQPEAAQPEAAQAGAAQGAQFHLAAGAALGFQNRKEYGAGDFSRVYPEIVAYGYFGGFMGPVWARPGLRLAYVTEQAEMPQAARVEERDLSVSGELGFVWDWYVVPSLAVGGGVISRRIELVTDAPVQGGGNIDARETLPFVHAQAGIGIPLLKGFAVVEPFYRHAWVERDARITYTYGLELTLEIL